MGGSSGGCHALWVALTSTASDGSGWNAAARGKIKAVVSLSGPTDLGNWTDYDKNPDGTPAIDIVQFEEDGENYTSTTQNPPDDPDKQVILTANSPISLMPHATAVPPILMFATELDPVPWQQGSNMLKALNLYNVTNASFHKVNATNGDHAFNYWFETDGDDSQGRCVKQEVIDFLNSHP